MLRSTVAEAAMVAAKLGAAVMVTRAKAMMNWRMMCLLVSGVRSVARLQLGPVVAASRCLLSREEEANRGPFLPDFRKPGELLLLFLPAERDEGIEGGDLAPLGCPVLRQLLIELRRALIDRACAGIDAGKARDLLHLGDPAIRDR